MQIKKELKTSLLELNQKITLNIDKQILEKIKFLCHNIKDVEWSGILFYKLKGTISNPDKVSIDIKDILLMNKGSKTYTNFSWDSDLVNYQINNPISIEENWIKGLIHSHNTMSVFFSKEDIDELRINTPLHNIYLSLIVNNYMEMAARVCFSVKPSKYTALNENGKTYNIEIEDCTDETLVFYECDINHPDKYINVSEEFKSRYKTISEKSNLIAASTVMNNTINNMSLDNTNNYNKVNNTNYVSMNHLYSNSWEDIDIDTSKIVPIEDTYICFILRFGSLLENDTIMDILEDLDVISIDMNNYLESIKIKFFTLSKKFFTLVNSKFDINTIAEYLTKIEEKLDTNYKGFLVKNDITKFIISIRKELSTTINIDFKSKSNKNIDTNKLLTNIYSYYDKR